jgi:hypothetical protein
MKYNTNSKRLALPEYGRNIQNMIDYCLTIKDKDERNNCAVSILGIMGNMFPHLRDVNNFKHILWDHLAIMSDFKLDVDYPYEVLKKENLYQRPSSIPYDNQRIRYRHYGHMLEELIRKATGFEEGEEKEVLILSIANQMKKSFLLWNKDVVDDEKILNDLAELSNGKIVRTAGNLRLTSSTELIEVPQRSKKHKKNYSRKG